MKPQERARYEHAWRLRCEGLKLREIGERLGVGRERARQLVAIFGRGDPRVTGESNKTQHHAT